MPSLVSEYTLDFSAGANDSAAPTAMPKTSVRTLYNGRIQPDGSLKRRPGSIRLHAAALNAAIGYGGSRFTTAAGVDQLVVIFGAKAYYSADYGATWAEIATGLREDYYCFATMRVGATNYLFCANGDTTIKRWDGATWDTLPGAPSGVKYVACFNNRLYATGHSGVLVQASAIGAPQTWASPSGMTVQVTDLPVGLYQIGPHLLVFNRHATSYVDGFGEATIIVASGATGFSRSVGCVGFRTISGVGDNGVCWRSERGVEYYSPSGGIQLLSKAVMAFDASIDWTELYANPGRMTSCYDDIEQNYHLMLSTNGSRNNRALVLNLLQEVQYQRSGPRGSAAVDQFQSPTGGDVVLGSDDGVYASVVPGGYGLEADADGYAVVTMDAPGTLAADADGYLDETVNDTLPATVFTAPSATLPVTMYSLGYDGFVRRHSGATHDDTLSDGTGGTDVTMAVVSRAFLAGRARQRKRVRAVHLAVVTDEAVSIQVAVRGGGKQRAQHTLNFPATALGQSCRKKAMTHLIADEPQVEFYVTNDAKITLVGVSAELLREGV